MSSIRNLIWIAGCLVCCLSTTAQAGQRPFCLTLGDALQKADAINLQVMMANARLSQAIARISQSQSNLLPRIDAIASGARQTGDLRAEGIQVPGFGPRVGPYNSFDARARVTITLFDASAFERFQAAKKGQTLSEAALQKTREDVLALVADLFIDAQRKQQTFKLMQIVLDRDRMADELSQESYTQGTGTLLDANKSKSDLAQTKYVYAQAKQQALDARLDLEAALQMPLNRPLVFLDDKDLLKMLEHHAGINFKNATNADMVLAVSTLDARKADQRAAAADFLPKVSGSAEYGRAGASPDRGSNVYDVGLNVSVPIWEGGSQQANLKEVKGEVKEAQENLMDASQQAQVDVAKARAAIVEARGLKQAKSQARQTAQRSLRIAFQAQEIGNGTVLEVMRAKAELALAEDEYNEAQAAWVMAHIDLFHAQGRLRELIKQ